MRTTIGADHDVPIGQFLKEVLLQGLTAESKLKEMKVHGEDTDHIVQTMQHDGFRTRTLFV